jgi:hypothetical protein
MGDRYWRSSHHDLPGSRNSLNENHQQAGGPEEIPDPHDCASLEVDPEGSLHNARISGRECLAEVSRACRS